VISDAVRDMVTSRIEVSLEDLGQLELKNLSRPVQAYSLRLPGITNGAIHSSPAARRAKLPSIAILPFRTLGSKPEEAYFGEGMVDDIIYALAGVRGAKSEVPSASSTASDSTAPSKRRASSSRAMARGPIARLAETSASRASAGFVFIWPATGPKA